MIVVGDSLCFHCDECPICEQLDLRLRIARDFGEFQYDYCACEKIGFEFWQGGFCGDAISQKRKSFNFGKRRKGYTYRKEMKRRKFERARAIAEHTCKPGVGWVHSKLIDGEWVDGTYMQYGHTRRQKAYKKHASKRARKADAQIKGNGYRRSYDYWRDIY